MYADFSFLFENNYRLLEILTMLVGAGILGYLLCWVRSARKINDYWARINLNKHDIAQLKNSVNYDDLLTTLNTKVASLEKKLSKLKAPTIDQLDLSNFATIDMIPKALDLSHYVKRDQLPKIDLTHYIKKDQLPKIDLSHYVKKDQLPKIDLSEYAKKSEIPEQKQTKIDANQLVKKSDLDKYALSNQLQKFVQKDHLTSFVKFTDLKTQLKKVSQESESNSYVKKEDLSAFLKKSEMPQIPDLSNFAKKQDLSHYLRKSDLPKTEVDEFVKKEELAPYLKKSELPIVPDFSNFAKKEDVSELENKIETVDTANIKQDDDIKELKSILDEIPKPKKKVVELDKRGIPKSTILHMLSIKDVDYDKRKRDDLQEIKGIGPFIEKKVNALGIYTFLQISKLNKDDVQLITDAIKFFPGRIIRDDWVGQAKKLST